VGWLAASAGNVNPNVAVPKSNKARDANTARRSSGRRAKISAAIPP
jgi:hypothetical protein